MRYRIKIETLNNGTVYYTAQVCTTPPYTGWFKCFDTTTWCSITTHGGAHDEAYCTLILDRIRQTSENVALQCIEAYKRQMAKYEGEMIATTEFKYL